MSKIVQFLKSLIAGPVDPYEAIARAVEVFDDARVDLLEAADALEAMAAERNLTIERLQEEVANAVDEAQRAVAVASRLEGLLA